MKEKQQQKRTARKIFFKPVNSYNKYSDEVEQGASVKTKFCLCTVCTKSKSQYDPIVRNIMNILVAKSPRLQ